jgi:hypothetical protein
MSDDQTKVDNGLETTNAGGADAGGASEGDGGSGEVAGNDGTAPAQQAPAQQTPASTGSGSGAAPDVRKGIDIDAELTAKEQLADDLEQGRIEYTEYNKKVAAIDRKITQGQREMLAPAKEIKQASDTRKANQQFFQGWGKGQSVAELKYGKLVAGPTSEKLFAEAEAEVIADPTYNRPEFDTTTVVRMVWMKKLEAESKKPKPTTAGPKPVQQASARISGSAGSGGQAQNQGAKTARQKLNDGDYGDLSGEMEPLLGG